MENIIEWLVNHWPELAAALGIGGGGGLISKKLIDSKQDDKIESIKTMLNSHQSKINMLERKLIKIGIDVETNSKFDFQFREQVDKDRSQILDTLKEIKEAQSKMIDYLLNKG